MSSSVQQGASNTSLLTTSHLTEAARSDGIWITSSDNIDYLDGASGAVVSSLGHGNQRVITAVTKQLETLDYVHRGQFENYAVQRLSNQLLEIADIPDGRCYFFSSGSEAVEAAAKIAYLYQDVVDGPTGHIATRRVSYHGATIEASKMTGHEGKRGAYNALITNSSTLPGVDVSDSANDALRAIEDILLQGDVPNILPAGLLLETIPGASAGATVPPAGYYEKIRDLCDESRMLWIADEVMTGVGRTGRWFGYHHWDAVPDIVCVGKGLGAGYWPISAIIVRKHIADAVLSAMPTPVGHTHSNQPAGAAAGTAVIEEISEHSLLDNVVQQGEFLQAELQDIARSVPGGEAHGIGLMQSLHFEGENRWHSAQALVQKCFERGLLVYEAPASVAGTKDAILITPPLNIASEDMSELVYRLEKVIQDLNREEKKDES